jgi:7-cyano-7-deazaguanine synthase in queuosine biosynthesis
LSTAIALLSGGLDSATAAARIFAQLDLAEHHTISVNPAA